MSHTIQIPDGRFVPRTVNEVPLPTKLTLEAFGCCNLKCPLWPTGQGLTVRPRGPMRMPVFQETMRQLGDHVRIMDLFNWGEPLLNR